MATDNERVKLIFETVVEGQEKFARMQHNMNEVRKQVGRMSKSMRKATMPMIKSALWAEEMRGQYDSLGGSMAMSQENYKKFNQEGHKMNTWSGKTGNRIRMMTQGLRGFRMELLGIMFFGMAMNKMLMGWLKPAMDVFGIFDLINIMLMILFINVVEDLFPAFLKFFDWVIGWSDDTKTFVGWFVLLGAVMMGVLFAVGTLGLGIGSLIGVFGGLMAAKIVIWFSGFGLVLLGIVAIVAIVITYHKELERGMYAATMAAIEYSYGYQRLLVAYLRWMAKFDLTGAYSKAADSAEAMMFKTQDALMDISQKYNKVNAEIIAENEEQEESHEDLKDEMEKYNKQAIDSKYGLVNAEEDGNLKILESQFTTYSNMADNQGSFYDQMLNSTKEYVTKTNKELSKMSGSKGGKSSSSGTYEGTAATWLTPIGSEVGNSGWTRMNDFVWRAGQGAVAINKNDNLVGTKDGVPGGSGASVNISNITINSSNPDDVERSVIDGINKATEDLLRMVQPTGQ